MLKRLVKKLFFRIFIFEFRLLHRWGVLPYGNLFGFGRGLPVGRYYVENFLRDNASYVKGRCLDFGDPRYKSFFPQATQYEVLNISPGPQVDFVTDIHDLQNIPLQAFDAIICPQVFEHLAYPERAAVSLFELLKPGGVVLITAPFLNPVHYVPTDYRRFTPECLTMILQDAGLSVDFVSFGGNCLIGTGSFLGMVTEDFTKEEMDRQDPIFPYNILIRASRPLE